MALRVYSTLSKKLEEFSTLEPGRVKMYVCGLTPYDRLHLGHARTYVAFDAIRRFLEFKGFQVSFIQNVTDVDDKILKRAAEQKREPLELSEHFSKLALQEMDLLGITRADHYPKVSEHIPEIISLIQKLLTEGFAYETEDGVYFEVVKFMEYGKLSGQKLEEIRSGARIAVDEKKKHPADFALWKKAKPGEISWDSPWGKGRPGWHIECSAMSAKYLGESFDVHGGGSDLIFPHHENEIAQSEAASGKPFVRHWLHTGWLTVKKEKMSKSLKNFISVDEALKKYEPEVLRIFFSATHYRSPIDFNEESLEKAKASLETLRNAVANAQNAIASAKKRGKKEEWLDIAIEKHNLAFTDAMDNDFDSSTALAQLFEIARHINTYINEGNTDTHQLEGAIIQLRSLARIFGLLESIPKRVASDEDLAKARELAEGFGAEKEELSKKSFSETIELMISLRNKARKEKDFKKSDAIRSRLAEISVLLEDSEKATNWKFK